jgi:hypothetical protein
LEYDDHAPKMDCPALSSGASGQDFLSCVNEESSGERSDEYDYFK